MQPTNEEAQAFHRAVVAKSANLCNASKVPAGVDREEYLMQITNATIEDALSDEPKTKRGRLARAYAVEQSKKAVKSPFFKPVFDYDKHYNETALKAAKELGKMIGDRIDTLVLPLKPSETEKTAWVESVNKLRVDVWDILKRNKVPLKYIIAGNNEPTVFEALNQVINVIFEMAKTEVNDDKAQIQAVYMAARNPGNNKIDAGFATVEDLDTIKEQSFKDKNVKPEDYFYKEGEVERPDGV